MLLCVNVSYAHSVIIVQILVSRTNQNATFGSEMAIRKLRTLSKLILYDPCYTSAHQSRTTDGLQRHVSSHTPVYRLTGDLHLPLPSLPTRMRNRAAARGYLGSCQTRTSNAAENNACHILKLPTMFVWLRLGSRCTTPACRWRRRGFF